MPLLVWGFLMFRCPQVTSWTYGSVPYTLPPKEPRSILKGNLLQQFRARSNMGWVTLFWDEEEKLHSQKPHCLPRKQALVCCIYYICGHQWSAGEMKVLEESCSKCSQNCSPSGSLAWLMSRSTESFQGQGFAPGAVQRGLYPQQAQYMQEGKGETVS